ncbi:MAG: Rho termination factor N-terminal domain-containing protein, partial [Deltaproteobacteria bacterium]|nr:Rho termination factor N-terminal domain-containing protein [Deltaproteobacteria bacterium]
MTVEELRAIAKDLGIGTKNLRKT